MSLFLPVIFDFFFCNNFHRLESFILKAVTWLRFPSWSLLLLCWMTFWGQQRMDMTRIMKKSIVNTVKCSCLFLNPLTVKNFPCLWVISHFDSVPPSHPLGGAWCGLWHWHIINVCCTSWSQKGYSSGSVRNHLPGHGHSQVRLFLCTLFLFSSTKTHELSAEFPLQCSQQWKIKFFTT